MRKIRALRSGGYGDQDGQAQRGGGDGQVHAWVDGWGPGGGGGGPLGESERVGDQADMKGSLIV
jgi:hypothetical protein